MHVLLKIGGPRCVTYFRKSRDVWQSVTEGGSQNWSKIAQRTLWTAPSERCHCGLHNCRSSKQLRLIVSQLNANNTGHGASYVNSLFIYPGVICYVGDMWVI